MSHYKHRRKHFSLCVFPGYRWCGPGCSGPGKPINDVDACCYYHDRCLKKGHPICYCDRQFLKCLRPKINRHTSKGRKAKLMYQLIKLKDTFTC